MRQSKFSEKVGERSDEAEREKSPAPGSAFTAAKNKESTADFSVMLSAVQGNVLAI